MERKLRGEKEALRDATIDRDPGVVDKRKAKKEQEKKDWQDIQKELKKFVYERIESEYYKGSGEEWMNPWKRS